MCEHLCVEEQVLSDSKVIKQHVMLRTESQTAADQSHVLTDVVTTDIGPATGGRKQPCKHKHKRNQLGYDYLGGIHVCPLVACMCESVFELVTCQHGQCRGLPSTVVS